MSTMPDTYEADAAELVRALSTVAGDEGRVLAVLNNYAAQVGIKDAVKHAAAALVLTFGRYITTTTDLDQRHPVPVTIPSTTTREAHA